MRYSIIAEDTKTIIMTGYITLDAFEVNKKFKHEELIRLEELINRQIMNGVKLKASDIFKVLNIEVPDKWFFKQNDYELVKGVVFEWFHMAKRDTDVLKIDWL